MAREKGRNDDGISFGNHPGHAPRQGNADEGGEADEGEEEEEDEGEYDYDEGSGAAKRTEAVDRRNRVKEAAFCKSVLLKRETRHLTPRRRMNYGHPRAQPNSSPCPSTKLWNKLHCSFLLRQQNEKPKGKPS